MSWSANISVYFEKPILDPLISIMSLIDAGWRASWESGRAIMFLPLGDNGMFDWKDSDTWQQAVTEIQEKVDQKELIGVVLYYEDTDAQFLFDSGYTRVSVNLNSVGRHTINGNKVTDFSWYLQRIVPPLSEGQDEFASLTCSDMR